MSGTRLNSWKEIAAHLARTVRTVQRWERTCGLPVHRHGHLKASSVYAYRSELDGWWARRHAPVGAAVPPSAACIRVFPFDDLSPAKAEGPLCDALVEELSATLDAFSEVAVTRGSDVLVEGSVARDGPTVKVTVTLSSADALLGSFSCEASRDHAASLHERLASEVLERLHVPVPSARQLARRHTFDVAAYDLYLMSRHYWNQRTVDGLRKAIALSEQAIERDPSYAQAHASLALAWATLGTYLPEPSTPLMQRGRAAAERGLALDPNLTDAHTALAFIAVCHDWAWARADESFRRATSLNPRNATAWQWHSMVPLVTGRDADALTFVLRAEQEDPTSLPIRSHVAWTLYFLHRFDEAVDRLEQILQWDRKFWRVYFNVGWCYAQLGQYDKARKAMETSVALNDYLTAQAALAHVYARAGRIDAARKIVRRLLAQPHYVSHYWLALAYLGLDDHSAAIRSLERALAEREWFLIFLTREPMFDPIRRTPAFARLVTRVGLALPD